MPCQGRRAGLGHTKSAGEPRSPCPPPCLPAELGPLPGEKRFWRFNRTQVGRDKTKTVLRPALHALRCARCAACAALRSPAPCSPLLRGSPPCPMPCCALPACGPVCLGWHDIPGIYHRCHCKLCTYTNRLPLPPASQLPCPPSPLAPRPSPLAPTITGLWVPRGERGPQCPGQAVCAQRGGVQRRQQRQQQLSGPASSAGRWAGYPRGVPLPHPLRLLSCHLRRPGPVSAAQPINRSGC